MKDTMHLLLVEDDESWGKIYLEEFEEDSKLECVWATSYDDAKIELKRQAFDIVIVDLSLAEGGTQQTFQGIQLVQELSALLHPPIVIVSTGYRERAESDPEFPIDFVFAIHDKIESRSKLREAVERARRLKRVQSLLVSASKYVPGTTPITEELKRMLGQLVKLTDAYVCHLLLPTEDRRYLEIVVDTGGDEGRQVEIDDSVIGEVFKTRRPINLGDTATHPRYKDISGDKKMKSELAVPLLEDSRAIGVLNIESEYRDAFMKEHEDLMTTFARFVVATLQNDRRRQDLQDLVGTTTSQLLEAVVDLEKVFDTILDRGLKLINADSGLLALVEGEQLRIVSTTHEEEWPKGSTLQKSGSICGLAVQRGYAINVRDITQEPYKRYFKPALGKYKLSALVIPLRLGDKVIGVLNFESTEPAAFASEDQRLLVALASQAAVAIRITQELERRSEQLRIAERSATISDLTAGLAHNVNSPADGILFDLNQIRMNYATLEEHPNLKDYLERIERAANSILKVPRLIAEKMEQYEPPVPMTCEELVVPKLKTMKERGDIPPGISIAIDETIYETPRFLAYEFYTPLVIENLVTNAIHVMKGQDPIKIGALRAPDDSWVEIWIEDAGPGVPKGFREIIFDRDFTTREEQRSGGVGLWWVKTHLERLKATVWVEDTATGVGARFVVRFPTCDPSSLAE